MVVSKRLTSTFLLKESSVSTHFFASVNSVRSKRHRTGGLIGVLSQGKHSSGLVTISRHSPSNEVFKLSIAFPEHSRTTVC